MTKSSEVLRLAAELSFKKDWAPIWTAALESSLDQHCKLNEYAELAGYFDSSDVELDTFTLCLAAAIAESEGD